jgi:hypothetical protein
LPISGLRADAKDDDYNREELKVSEAEQAENSMGPVMLSMTSALKPPPARIAKLGNNLVLPRSIPVLQAAAATIGSIVGLTLTAIFIVPFFGATLTTFGLGAGIFGGLAVLAVSWSPLRGESFAKWIGLNLEQYRLDRVEIDGLRAKAYIGIAPLHCSALGSVRIISGAANVLVGSVDERGVLIPHAERRREIAGAHAGRLPGHEEGFERPRWLAEGEANGDARRISNKEPLRMTRNNSQKQSDQTFSSMGATEEIPVQSRESRWGIPEEFENGASIKFESEKKLDKQTAKRSPRRRKK